MKNWTTCLSGLATLLHKVFPSKVMLSYENDKKQACSSCSEIITFVFFFFLSHFYGALDRQTAGIRKKG